MAVGKFPIEASHIMMFARSIGDSNQIYYDEDYAKESETGDIIAPPTFVKAREQFDPQSGLRPKNRAHGWFGSGGKPTGVKPREDSAGASGDSGGGGGGGLHAEQRYIYHRHPKVGDVLTATNKPGKVWEKEGKRSGKLVFSESITEYRDQDGELVVTAIGTGVRTERPVDQG